VQQNNIDLSFGLIELSLYLAATLVCKKRHVSGNWLWRFRN